MKKERRIKLYKKIRKDRKSGQSVAYIAWKYGLTRQRIYQILKGVDNFKQ